MTDKLKSTEKQVDRLKSTEQPKVVQKANIATMYKTGVIFNELEQDLLEYIISQININDTTKKFQWITFRVIDFFFVTKRKFRPYNEIRAALHHIRDTGIYINEVSYTSWITSVNSPTGTGLFSVEINETIKDFLGFIHGNYVKYESEYVYCLRSIYSKKLYPMLKAILIGKPTKTKEFTLKELKDLFSISDDKYKKYNHFKEKVILQAQKEINNQTDIIFDFKEEKNGHAVYKLIFTITNNTNQNTHTTQGELDTHHPMFVLFEKYKFGNKLKRQLFKSNATDIEKMNKNLTAAYEYIQDHHVTDEKEIFALYTDSVNNNWEPKIKKAPETQTEPKKADKVGYTYQKEKDFQKNKTVRVDEPLPVPVVDEIPDKTEFDEQLDINFKEKIEKQLDSSMINILIDDNEIHFYLDTKNSRVKVYFPISVMQYFIDNKIERRLNNLLLVADIIQKPFDTDGVQKLFYKVTLIGVKQ